MFEGTWRSCMIRVTRASRAIRGFSSRYSRVSTRTNMADDVKLWCAKEISKFLGADVGPEFSDYLFSIENVGDVEEYLVQLLDPNDDNVKAFVEKVCQYWQSSKKRKPKEEQKGKRKDAILPVQSSPTCKTSKSESVNEVTKQTVITKGEKSPVKKKNSQFVPLYSDEGKAKTSVRLPGRHPCECLGQKHKLVNNCLQCGRIVCEQEGSGPCYFCGEIVCTKEEKELLAKNSKRGQKLREKLLDSWNIKANEDEEMKHLSKATELKDRLLEYDRTSVRRTKVIDDESDYFATDSKWLSEKDRKVLKEKEEKIQKLKHRPRREMKVTLDFAGRKITEDGVTDEMNDLYMSAEEYLESTLANNSNSSHPNYVTEPPLFVVSEQQQSGDDNVKRTKYKTKQSSRNTIRIQDKELLEMSDSGQCLSMHQPWASLLVNGIKKAEGRVWYTTHRGRLWIAATAKQPSQEEIRDLENYYRALGERSRFPEYYPSGCLLGCVDVVDCLPQTEYKENFPNGEESDSPFVFIVDNPRELVVKFPVKGQHKIWKLDKHIHQAAKKGLT